MSKTVKIINAKCLNMTLNFPDMTEKVSTDAEGVVSVPEEIAALVVDNSEDWSYLMTAKMSQKKETVVKKDVDVDATDTKANDENEEDEEQENVEITPEDLDAMNLEQLNEIAGQTDLKWRTMRNNEKALRTFLKKNLFK